MPKPILLYRLTPTQIALVDRLAQAGEGVLLSALGSPQITVWLELEKLGMAKLQVNGRRKLRVVLTPTGEQIRANGYLSPKPVVRLTEPQIAALRFIVGDQRKLGDVPGPMLDVIRRLSLRGWAQWDEMPGGKYRIRLTTDGWNVLRLVDAGREARQ